MLNNLYCDVILFDLTDLKGNSTDFTHQSLRKKAKSDKLPQMMSREATFLTSSLKLKKKKICWCGVRKKWVVAPQLEAASATASITHLNLQLSRWWSSCIVGNGGTRCCQGRRICGTKKIASLVLLYQFFSFFLFNCPLWVWQSYKTAMLNQCSIRCWLRQLSLLPLLIFKIK